MRILFITLLSLIGTTGFTQSIPTSAITGTWTAKTVEVQEMEMDAQQQIVMDKLKEGFLGANYHFLANSDCKIEFKNGAPMMMPALALLNDAKWKYDETTSTISIGTEADNYSLMRLRVEKIEDQVVFFIEESPFKMKMLKQQ